MAEAFEQEITKLYEAREQEREAKRLQSSLSPHRGRRLSNLSLERFRTSIKYQASPASPRHKRKTSAMTGQLGKTYGSLPPTFSSLNRK
jgi:hypothetical protein